MVIFDPGPCTRLLSIDGGRRSLASREGLVKRASRAGVNSPQGRGPGGRWLWSTRLPRFARNDRKMGRNDGTPVRNGRSNGRDDRTMGRNDGTPIRNGRSNGRDDRTMGRNGGTMGRHEGRTGRRGSCGQVAVTDAGSIDFPSLGDENECSHRAHLQPAAASSYCGRSATTWERWRSTAAPTPTQRPRTLR